MNIDITKIKENIWVSIISFILVLSSGILAVIVFNYEVFISLDIIKLVLLSLAVITPFLVINIFISFLLDIFTNSNNSDDDQTIFTSCLLSLIPIIISTSISAFFRFNILVGMYIALGIEIIMIILIIKNIKK